jgi:hypothetical protein
VFCAQVVKSTFLQPDHDEHNDYLECFRHGCRPLLFLVSITPARKRVNERGAKDNNTLLFVLTFLQGPDISRKKKKESKKISFLHRQKRSKIAEALV